MSTPLRAIVFDLDGTLVDSLQDIAFAANAALAAVGAPARSSAEIASMVGHGVHHLLGEALGTQDDSQIEAARAVFAPAYAACVVQHTRLYDGLQPVLTSLSAVVPLAIATNKPARFTAPIYERLHLARWFSGVASGDEVPNKKPDPAVVHLALERAGLPARGGDLAYVGDMPVDIQTARALGALAVGVQWGFAGDLVQSAGPDILARHPSDLIELVHRGAS